VGIIAGSREVPGRKGLKQKTIVVVVVVVVVVVAIIIIIIIIILQSVSQHVHRLFQS